ncbi:CHAT domain-containing protein [Roridomyces roridus]|uniref:CHAT domain-containing protein n=1 Tax=Roridomyces roridus TaxID=1738132 RepID=A0AAD7B8K6_9AGAR|nr:CHAT domain-containing protein [Roridomyces roridus]
MHLTSSSHLNQAAQLNNLARSLLSRFEQLGTLEDLHKSVAMQRQAVGLTSDDNPEKSAWLNNLGGSLLKRFQQLNTIEDLQESVAVREHALRLTPDGHPEKASHLNNLGSSLGTRFEQLSTLGDLHQAVIMREQALGLTPDDHPEKATRLINLGGALLRRFQHLSTIEDLHRSVVLQEQAVDLTADSHSSKASRMHNLGGALLARFKQLGTMEDLHRSVKIHDQAVSITPDSHADKAAQLDDFGGSVLARFQQLNIMEDLQRSVAVREQALGLTPDDHPDKASRLNNLGTSLMRRFEQLSNMEDLHRSVLVREQALGLTPNGHPDRASRLNNLGNSLITRFEQLRIIEDLHQAIDLQEQAVGLTPYTHPETPARLLNLGNSLVIKFHQFHDIMVYRQAEVFYTRAACSTVGPPAVRFNCACNWAYLSTAMGESPMPAYQVALGLLPDLAWLGMSISDRHRNLIEAVDVGRATAEAAIMENQPEQALEWLEQGRSVIWGQLLNLRTPIDLLQDKYPQHAAELLSLSAQLEASGMRSTMESSPSPQLIANQAFQAAQQRQELLTHIRQLSGFERFLLPKTISELSAAAQEGPVVTVNVTPHNFDALVLIPSLDSEVLHIPLGEHKEEIQSAMNASIALESLVGRNIRLNLIKEGQITTEEQFKAMLSGLWVGIVKPVLDGLALNMPTSPENKPHIWWCLNGPLTFLPIHAAGIHDNNQPIGSNISDYVVSSYTPSLAALIEGYRTGRGLKQSLQILAVVQPNAVGQQHIPGTRKEIKHIERIALANEIPVVALNEDMATISRVQEEMKKCQWAHFACHGVQDVNNPTESALLLAGSSHLTLSNIIELALPHADFAFLSACQTATGDRKLREESVHLAAGMLSAGYRSVIATMWTIRDDDAPEVAKDVYEYLLKESSPDSTKAAEALHFAIQKLRKGPNGKSFLNWVPYIHLGV